MRIVDVSCFDVNSMWLMYTNLDNKTKVELQYYHENRCLGFSILGELGVILYVDLHIQLG